MDERIGVGPEKWLTLIQEALDAHPESPEHIRVLDLATLGVTLSTGEGPIASEDARRVINEVVDTLRTRYRLDLA